MWKTRGKPWGCKKNTSTGGVGKRGGFSTELRGRKCYPHFATSFPHLSVESQGRKERPKFGFHRSGAGLFVCSGLRRGLAERDVIRSGC